MLYDTIIIGAGPAGISASLYAKRAGFNVLVLYKGDSQLEKAKQIDNYYGFVNGIDGKSLYENGINQAKKIGVEVIEKEILDIELSESMTYNVKTVEEKFEAKTIIIATGNKKVKPNIKGINEFDGKGISYCAICDGFFYRNKNLVVIGNGNYAISEADSLTNIASSVKILTNGKEKPNTDKYEIDTRKIKEIHGELKVSKIEFEDGNYIDIDGIFIAEGEAGGSDFAKKLGIITQNDNIVVNENMETNVPGIYSCGNITGGLLQVSKAVYEGAKAGLSVVNYLKK